MAHVKTSSSFEISLSILNPSPGAVNFLQGTHKVTLTSEKLFGQTVSTKLKNNVESIGRTSIN